jgi:hypothetical protein
LVFTPSPAIVSTNQRLLSFIALICWMATLVFERSIDSNQALLQPRHQLFEVHAAALVGVKTKHEVLELL